MKTRTLYVILLVLSGAAAGWLLTRWITREPDLPDEEPPAATAPPAEPLDLTPFLGDVPDGVGFVESEGYLAALEALGTRSERDIRDLAGQPLDLALALEHPDELRGQWVRRRGVIAAVWAERLENGTPERTDVYRGVVTDTDGSDGVVFDMPAPQLAFEPRRDLVDVSGVFYRTLVYETADGTRVVPYMLARSVRKVSKKEGGDSTFHGATGPLAVLALMVCAWFLFRLATLARRPLGPLPPDSRRGLPRTSLRLRPPPGGIHGGKDDPPLP